MVLGTLTLGFALLIVSSRYHSDRRKTGYALRNAFALLTLLLGMLVGNVGGPSLPLPLPNALLRPRHTPAPRAECRHQPVVHLSPRAIAGIAGMANTATVFFVLFLMEKWVRRMCPPSLLMILVRLRLALL